MSAVAIVLVAFAVTSVGLAATLTFFGRAAAHSDAQHEREVLEAFGRLGRREGDRRCRDRRREPTLVVRKERRRGDRRTGVDRRTLRGPGDDRVPAAA